MKKFNLLLIVLGLGAIALKVTTDREEDRRVGLIAATNDPSELVATIVQEEKAKVSAEMKNGVATINLDIGAWRSASTRFEITVSQVTRKFFKKFASVNQIEYFGFTTFVDVRGNVSREVAARSTFTRRNAESINWDNVTYKNIPIIADQFWVHPAVQATSE